MEATILGACIRLYSTGPELHVNNAHVAWGIASTFVGPDDGYLWIMHATSDPVIAILCSPDETLTSRDITTGASGGTGWSRIRFAQHGVALDLRVASDYAKIAGAYSNLWYVVVHASTPSTPRLDNLERIVGMLAAGSGWDFDALASAYGSFAEATAANVTFDAMTTPRVE